jgi:hypothetical protein
MKCLNFFWVFQVWSKVYTEKTEFSLVNAMPVHMQSSSHYTRSQSLDRAQVGLTRGGQVTVVVGQRPHIAETGTIAWAICDDVAVALEVGDKVTDEAVDGALVSAWSPAVGIVDASEFLESGC